MKEESETREEKHIDQPLTRYIPQIHSMTLVCGVELAVLANHGTVIYC